MKGITVAVKRRGKGKTSEIKMKDDTITRWLRIDSRGRMQLKEEDRLCLGLKGGEMLEVTIKRAEVPKD